MEEGIIKGAAKLAGAALTIAGKALDNAADGIGDTAEGVTGSPLIGLAAKGATKGVAALLSLGEFLVHGG